MSIKNYLKITLNIFYKVVKFFNKKKKYELI